jgi:integrase
MARRHFGNVRKLPSGRYQAAYWHEGRRHVASETFKAKTDAQAWLATKEADIVRGLWLAQPTGKTTFGDYATTWLDRQGHLRPRTSELYDYLLRCHLLPAFRERALTAIANSEVVAWHRALTAKIPGTAPKCFRLLRQIMAAAVADGYLVKSPVVIKGASREVVHEQAIPTVAEVLALAEAVEERYRAMVWLAGGCGLRFGELAALRRDRIDLLHKEVRVAETVTELIDGERFAGPPKTEAGRRTVAIPSTIVPIVEQHLASIGPEPGTLLFPAPEGGYLRRHNFRQRVWVPALTATGLSYRFHDLRHAAMTLAAASGATIADLMVRAGHSSPRAAMIYQHASRERDHVIAEVMAAALAKPGRVG